MRATLVEAQLARHNPQMHFSPHLGLSLILILGLVASPPASSEPLAGPGDARLRHDLQLLNDTGVLNLPLTAWPISMGDIEGALRAADTSALSINQLEAYQRLRSYTSFELETDTWTPSVEVSLADNPRVIRTFEATPREQAEVGGSIAWLGERLTFKLAATLVDDPIDGEEVRPDGTYIGVALGNWSITAGWQERWWGPSRDGSLILGTNARPTPGISVQRIASNPFETKWLSWMGPWTLTTFITQLDDERHINDALLFGLRGSFRPPGTGLEIGISRTAQWCGDDRPCGLDTFVDLLLGKDNRGVNIDPEDEPGNQLGGFDIRWTLPRKIPAAFYMQWIGEDGRGGGGAIGSWLRQVGVEHWGRIGAIAHRTHFEVSDSMCREGGFGFSDKKPNCAYEHSIYRTGYRYSGRVMGHPTDGDTRSYSIGSTLVQSGGQTWNLSARYMEINRLGEANPRHSLSSTPLDVIDVQVSYETLTRFGRFYAGLAFSRSDDLATGINSSETGAFLRWSNH